MTTPSADTPLLEVALGALRCGLCVVPPREDGSKMPAGAWKEYQSRLPTEAELSHWYLNGYAHAGIGLICGWVSGNLELLEFEGRAVKAGLWDEFKAAAEAAGLLSLISRVASGYGEESPSGGIHLLYRVDGTVTGNTPLARRPSTAEELRENPERKVQVLIETRGEGGYVIVAPTSGKVHESGRAWRILAGGFDSIVTISASERSELLALARTFDQMPRPEAEPPRGSAPGTDAQGRPGDDFNARSRWADILQPHGWTYLFTTRDGNQHWRRPGKRIGTSATINEHGDGVLYVFTSSSPFDPEHAYTKFSAYAVLEHGGDYGAAARELRRQGYGAPAESAAGPAAQSAESHSAESCPQLPVLPEDFWASRAFLRTVRTAAHSRTVAADAVLASLLTRLAAGVPYQLALPPIVGTAVPLSQLASIVGPPGSGKSSAYGVAVDLLPLNPEIVRDRIPIGSGEGLVDALFDIVTEDGPNGKPIKVKRQTRHNASVYVDEGESLNAIGSRSGSTVLPMLRQLWTGGPLGQYNASVEARRVAPAGSHVYGVAVAFQPALAGALLRDVEAGTPQRFLWASSIDPNIPDTPPEWPFDDFAGRLEHLRRLFGHGDVPHWVRVESSIEQEVRDRRRALARGQITVDPMHTHRDLLKLKVAALLGILEHELLVVDQEDWQLAEVVVATSDAVLAAIQATVAESEEKVERATSARQARRHVEAVAAEEGHKTVLVARRIRDLANSAPGITVSVIRRRLDGSWRSFLEQGLIYAADQGWVEERSEPGRGEDSKRAVYPRGYGQ